MKRIFLAALAASLLLIGLPSAASAHHGKRHAACTRKHHAKCARAHVLSFGPRFNAPGGSAGSTSSPTTPTPGSGETAGTVTSYIAPVLTITLNNKTEVSGKVTESTRIECESPTPTGTGGGEEGDDDGGGEGSGGEGGEGAGDSRVGASSHDDWALAPGASTEPDDEGAGDDQGDEGNVQPCTTSALMPGTIVRAAELLLGGEGAVWEKVLLVS